ncbi:MAG: DUF5615 family PIN-like protein [Bacteroidota bacterium]
MILILCDENLPKLSVTFLREQGYDIRSIREELPGIADEEIVDISVEEDRLIVTFDSDFGTLIFKHQLKPYGVIYFRWKSFSPKEPGQFLHELIKKNELILENNLTVISRNSIRQREIQ